MQLRKSIVRNSVFPLLDLKNRSTVLKYLTFYKQSQWWNLQRLKEYNEKKLRAIISHAYNNVRYYRRVFRNLDLKPEDIKCAEDLKKIPILTRDMIMENATDFIALNRSKNKLFRIQTSGTTGRPLVLYKAQNEISSAQATFYRGLEWAGYHIGDKLADIWGRHRAKSWSAFLRENLRLIITRTELLDAYNLNPKTIEKSISKLNRIKPSFLRGYTSAIYSYARVINQNAISLKFQLDGISSTAEPLYEFQRNEIEKAFRCKVFNQYGSGEVNSLGFECENQMGLHIPIERVHVEILDENDYSKISNDEVGRIIVTSLENYAMPIIRYDTEDLARKNTTDKDSESCSCGRHLPLIDSVVGRVMDKIILPDGEIIHGTYFIILLIDMDWVAKYNINQFQLVQKKSDHLILKIDCKMKPNLREIEEYKNHIKKFLGEIVFDIEFVDQITPSASGKRKFIISEVKAGNR